MARLFLIPLVLAVVVTARMEAQALQAAAVGAHRAADSADGRTLVRLGWPAPAFADSSRRPSAWKWIAIGALGGAAVGGTLAAAHVARTDDAFFPGLAVGAGVVIGGIGGGLLGAIAHAITYRGPEASNCRLLSNREHR